MPSRYAIALKIDVDTYRGIEDGAARLASYLKSQKIPASFFVSLGPDNSGWAATRVLRHRGFLQKMRRTSALSLYGPRTALSGTLWPARPMGTSFKTLFHQWRDWGFEVSPHGYDHIAWHDHAAAWTRERAAEELQKVVEMHRFIFGEHPTSFAAPGWQAGAGSWKAMEALGLLYHSDTRGDHPFFPKIDGTTLKTLEIPTTLATWDELLSLEGVNRHTLVDETWKQLVPTGLNVWTVHAELEGTAYFPQFHEFIERATEEQVSWAFLPNVACDLLKNRQALPSEGIEQGSRLGRAGPVTCQVVSDTH